MKKTIAVLVAASLVATGAFALTDPADKDFTGKHNIVGPLQIDGTEVTATAAELNALDADTTIGSATLTVTDIKTDDITATGTTNATLDINLDPTADTNMLGVITINGGRASAAVQDADFLDINLLSGNDGLGGSETNTEVYAKISVATTDVTGGTEDGTLTLGVAVAGTMTTRLTASSTGVTTSGTLDTGTGEAKVDGKYAIVGGDATTGLMVQKATITATSAAVQTNTFAVAFGAAPVVVATYTEDPGDVRPIYVTSVSASAVVFTITADKNYSYIAVGTRP